MMVTNEEKKYYAVTCKCGHTGSRKTYIPITFPVRAYTGKEAAAIGRAKPRCKHDHADCVINVREVTRDEYKEICIKNANDPYLHCHSIQEQKLIDISDRLIVDNHYYENQRARKERKETFKPVFIGKARIRKPKKFIRNNYIFEEDDYEYQYQY